jgi:AAA domain (dynein-related subfamily)
VARLGNREGFYVAAARFVEECLRREGSLFTPGRAIWSESPISTLYERFVGSPDESKGVDFTTKLLGQLSGASADVIQLAGEMYYVLLAPQETDGSGRRAGVEAVLNASPEPVAVPADLLPGLQSGIASYGAALTRRFDQYVFLCEFARAWVGLSPADKEALLAEPFAFQGFAVQVPHKGAQAQVEALIHMVFPDAFETTVSLDQKAKLAAAFAEYVGDPTAPIDRQLEDIRSALTPELGENFSFYDEPLVSQWLTPGISRDGSGENAVWMVKAGRSDIHAPTVLQEGVIAVEWGELDDLSHVTRDDLADIMHGAFPDRPKSTQTRDTNELFAFAHEIEEGDLIVLPQQEARFAVGRVTGAYQHHPNRSNGGNHVHPVDWIRRDVARTEVPGLNEAIGIRGFTVRRLPSEIAKAVHQFAEGGPAAPHLVTGGALHLVAKWSAEHGADTVNLHQAVAEEHGEVWWGVIGSGERKKLSDENLERLRTQLKEDVETHVFVAGPAAEESFSTRLVEVAVERPADETLIPSYPPGERHSLWLKLANFESIDRVKLLQDLEPAAEPGGLVVLGNRTNPLIVRVRAMPRVWWVNQTDSYRRSREGGYLWAPQTNKVGRVERHHEALRYAKVGDAVLNYANGQIRAVSAVQGDAYAATRPDPEADQAWGNDGWRLDVAYHDLTTPLPLAAIPEGARRKEGSPFDKNGEPIQGYMFVVRDAFVSTLRGLSSELAALLPKDDETVTSLSGESYSEPSFEEIKASILGQGLALTDRTIRRYHLSLKSRGFVVLSGVSGTGKTWLAQAYAKAVGAAHCVVPVAPNWTTNEDLLGFKSPLGGGYQDTPFSNFLREASNEWDASVRESRAARPYHVILDEMNLARVEYYFAAFLSTMELRARDGEATIQLAKDDVVTLGPNLRFVGTVNIDETTHLFSDKVFDRAQLVELSVDRDELKRHVGETAWAATLLALWDALTEVAPFAFRIVDEIGVYLAHAEEIGVSWQEALDEQIYQKLLPKVKGGDSRIGPALEKLIELTEKFPLSHAKAQAMHESYVDQGFSSYF